jgi:hypothetical protein
MLRRRSERWERDFRLSNGRWVKLWLEPVPQNGEWPDMTLNPGERIETPRWIIHTVDILDPSEQWEFAQRAKELV